MKNFREFLEKNLALNSIDRIFGGAGCTGGGAKNLGDGCWETWTGDYTDNSGATSYCGRLVICKS